MSPKMVCRVRCLLASTTVLFASLCLTGAAFAQRKMPYEGNWACSYMVSSSFVDLTTTEKMTIRRNRAGYGNFVATEIKKNVFRVKYANGILEQYTILDNMVLMIDNSEQTQFCLRQED